MRTVDYGIDRPERVRGFAILGLMLIATGLSQFIALRSTVEIWPEMILSICLWVGMLLIFVAGIMLWSSRTGKFGLAWKMLEDMNWVGNEHVLDVGCGRGLLTILAARKVPVGTVLGVDVWNQEHLSDNTKEAATENADLERVTARVTFDDGDATKLQYRPGTFDKIISSLCLHGIGSRPKRNKAVADLIVLLKPGGEIAIMDILHTREYRTVFEKQGLKNIRRSPMKFLYCLPTRYVIGNKPILDR